MYIKKVYKKGFTVIEILITLAILGILLAIVLPSLSNMRTSQAAQTHVEHIDTFFSEARTRTVSSQNLSRHGVNLSSSRIVLFEGETYSTGDPFITEFRFEPGFSIHEVSVGGGWNVVFDRLTGGTANAGWFTFGTSDGDIMYTISIEPTGVLDISRNE